MNKQDLLEIRKELKLKNTMLRVREIYSVYLKKDKRSVIHSEFEHFESFDSEKQELYLKSFKKILSGAVDIKLFELEFAQIDNEDNVQKILYSAVKEGKDIFKEEADKIVSRVVENYRYGTDVVITFIKVEYCKGANKRRKKEVEEAKDNQVSAFEFMMCSVNKIEHPKQVLKFDYKEKEFKANLVLYSTINLNSPLEGFMFPVFNNNCADVNRIMYYTAKPKHINISSIQGILNCEFKKTAQEEKGELIGILRNVVAKEIASESMETIYGDYI